MGLAVVGTLVFLYAAACALAFIWQRDFVFPAPQVGRPPQQAERLRGRPGGPLLLWLSPPTVTADVVVHFHGNAEQVADTEPLGDLVASAGLGFAAVEYPGYGLRSGDGAPSEEALVGDALEAVELLAGPLGVARDRLVLSGQSLGTGVAVELARRGVGSRMLLVSPYTSLPDVAAAMLPFLPVRWLMRDRFASADKAPDLALPVLVVHGEQDEVIPFALGRTLASRFPSGRLLAIPEGHHNDLWARPEVRAAVTAFLRGP